MFPHLARFTDFALLLMRLMVGLVFVTSGYSHLKDPAARAKHDQPIAAGAARTSAGHAA